MAFWIKTHPHSKKKRRNAFLKKSVLYFILLTVFFALLVATVRYQKFFISDVEIVGNVTLDTDELKNKVLKNLEGKYFYLIPRKSIFFYPKGGIKRDISYSFKKVLKVDLAYKSFKNPRIIVVSILERKPEYVWCGESTEEKSASGCYFIDARGFIFDPVSRSKSDTFTVFYGSLYSSENEILGLNQQELAGRTDDSVLGGRFLSETRFDGLKKFIDGVRALGLSTAELVKKDDDDYELRLTRGGNILFSLGNGTERILSNLESALETDPLRTNLAQKTKYLDYIDLRFGNKVFFKFK